MPSILDVRIKKLFAVALVLKIASSLTGWYVGDPWIFGLVIPLLVMIGYIMIGVKRHDTEVTDEKFADSCYYLGFIFTITSIILSLFDLPNIGTQIQSIAVRFGAAMISTVLGLGVRVYLVSFKKDVADAINDAEDAVLEAARKFTDQLNIAVDRLEDFSSRTDEAARKTVDRVNIQIEASSKNHAEKLSEFFSELTANNQKAFEDSLAEVRRASSKLADNVDQYANGMRANLESVGSKVNEISKGIETRLEQTTFPDDFFSRNLQGPLEQLSQAAGVVLRETGNTATAVREATGALSGALKALGDKAAGADAALDKVLHLTKQQEAVLNAAAGQLHVLQQFPVAIEKIGGDFREVAEEVRQSRGETVALGSRVATMTSEGVEARDIIKRALMDVAARLEEHTAFGRSLEAQISSATTTAEKAVAKLEAAADAGEKTSISIAATGAASEKIASELRDLVSADIDAARVLAGIEGNAERAVAEVREAAGKLSGISYRLDALDTALRVQGKERAQLDGRSADVKIGGQFPAAAGEPAMSSAGIDQRGGTQDGARSQLDAVAEARPGTDASAEMGVTDSGRAVSTPGTVSSIGMPVAVHREAGAPTDARDPGQPKQHGPDEL